MPHHVTAGLDGSAESAAAAEWAAREARLRQVALRLLLVSDGPAPSRPATEPGGAGAGGIRARSSWPAPRTRCAAGTRVSRSARSG
ncbi:universal stress protein [Streptomyces sp. I6]|uniref:universal stress protein n=1 Tax=Streptomyces sp. I6 TaxID=2483113 RepID=UPI0028809FFF|nr:universal stress protein [Streptomyces sp. I6]